MADFEQKFFVLANMVKQHPVEELVSQLKSRKLISKEQVLRESKSVFCLKNSWPSPPVFLISNI